MSIDAKFDPTNQLDIETVKSQFKIYQALQQQLAASGKQGLDIFDEGAFFVLNKDGKPPHFASDEWLALGDYPKIKIREAFEKTIPQKFEDLNLTQQRYLYRYGAAPVIAVQNEKTVRIQPTSISADVEKSSWWGIERIGAKLDKIQIYAKLDKIPKDLEGNYRNYPEFSHLTKIKKRLILYGREAEVISMIDKFVIANPGRNVALIFGERHVFHDMSPQNFSIKVADGFAIKYDTRYRPILRQQSKRAAITKRVMIRALLRSQAKAAQAAFAAKAAAAAKLPDVAPSVSQTRPFVTPRQPEPAPTQAKTTIAESMTTKPIPLPTTGAPVDVSTRGGGRGILSSVFEGFLIFVNPMRIVPSLALDASCSPENLIREDADLQGIDESALSDLHLSLLSFL